MANEIDLLMDLDPLEMTTANIEALIAHHRKNRANSEAGIKPKKERGPEKKIDLLSLGLGRPKPQMVRR